MDSETKVGPLVFDAARWRKRAEQLRSAASETTYSTEKEHLLKLAADFEQFAERAAAFAKGAAEY